MEYNQKVERKQILELIKEIDRLLGTNTKTKFILNHKNSYLWQSVLASLGVDAFTYSYSIVDGSWNEESKKVFAIAALIGGLFTTKFAIDDYKYYKNDKYGFKEIYSKYDLAYKYLSREEQLKVLDLSKKLLLKINDLKYEKNINFVKNYLNIEDSAESIFETIENSHPHHEILSQEEIDNIHSRDCLTPEEAVRYWESEFGNVCIPANPQRCKTYGDCHDCLVSYANESGVCKKISFKARNII